MDNIRILYCDRNQNIDNNVTFITNNITNSTTIKSLKISLLKQLNIPIDHIDDFSMTLTLSSPPSNSTDISQIPYDNCIISDVYKQLLSTKTDQEPSQHISNTNNNELFILLTNNQPHNDVSTVDITDDFKPLNDSDYAYIKQSDKKGYLLELSTSTSTSTPNNTPPIWIKRYCILTDKMWILTVIKDEIYARFIPLTHNVTFLGHHPLYPEYNPCLYFQWNQSGHTISYCYRIYSDNLLNNTDIQYMQCDIGIDNKSHEQQHQQHQHQHISAIDSMSYNSWIYEINTRMQYYTDNATMQAVDLLSCEYEYTKQLRQQESYKKLLYSPLMSYVLADICHEPFILSCSSRTHTKDKCGHNYDPSPSAPSSSHNKTYSWSRIHNKNTSSNTTSTSKNQHPLTSSPSYSSDLTSTLLQLRIHQCICDTGPKSSLRTNLHEFHPSVAKFIKFLQCIHIHQDMVRVGIGQNYDPSSPHIDSGTTNTNTDDDSEYIKQVWLYALNIFITYIHPLLQKRATPTTDTSTYTNNTTNNNTCTIIPPTSVISPRRTRSYSHSSRNGSTKSTSAASPHATHTTHTANNRYNSTTIPYTTSTPRGGGHNYEGEYACHTEDDGDDWVEVGSDEDTIWDIAMPVLLPIRAYFQSFYHISTPPPSPTSISLIQSNDPGSSTDTSTCNNSLPLPSSISLSSPPLPPPIAVQAPTAVQPAVVPQSSWKWFLDGFFFSTQQPITITTTDVMGEKGHNYDSLKKPSPLHIPSIDTSTTSVWTYDQHISHILSTYTTSKHTNTAATTAHHNNAHTYIYDNPTITAALLACHHFPSTTLPSLPLFNEVEQALYSNIDDISATILTEATSIHHISNATNNTNTENSNSRVYDVYDSNNVYQNMYTTTNSNNSSSGSKVPFEELKEVDIGSSH